MSNPIKTNLSKFINENKNNMKELILEGLNSAFSKLQKIAPKNKSKTITKNISIEDVEPMNLPKFMEDNNIPSDAYFSETGDGYSGLGRVVLAWEVNVHMSPKELFDFKKKRFDGIAWASVYEILTNNGYTRIGVNTALLRKFDDTTIYEMYTNSEFDRLIEYYSMYFKK